MVEAFLVFFGFQVSGFIATAKTMIYNYRLIE